MFKLFRFLLIVVILITVPSYQSVGESVEEYLQSNLFNSSPRLKGQAWIENVPFFRQLPELERGCEVTSLAMLLLYGGVQVDKMTLAREIEYVSFKQGNQHGNPNQGFVGDMYNRSNPGYGVYHAPVFRLAQKYLPDKVTDLTGRNIEDVYKFIESGSPVWVITNVKFQPLKDSEFETWQTNDGEIKITYYEHSVVVVGYDTEFVYINDPLAQNPNVAVQRESFEKAWEQMGKQGITILHN